MKRDSMKSLLLYEEPRYSMKSLLYEEPSHFIRKHYKTDKLAIWLSGPANLKACTKDISTLCAYRNSKLYLQ